LRFARLVCVLAIATGATQALAADEPDWQPLFDGKTLDGWIKRSGEAKYRVEDGAIVGQAVLNTPNTFLCTTRDYTDFILEYDFKCDPRLNSGVQIRSNSVSGYHQGRVHGYQVEIDPTERALTCGIYDEDRRGWMCDPMDKAAAKKACKPDDWNQVRVEARGDSIKTWLNGVAVADWKDSLTRTGFIGLQVHSTDIKDTLEVRWRNLRIKDLGDPWSQPPAGAVVLLGKNGDLAAWESAKTPGSKAEWTWTGDALEVKPGSGDIVTKTGFGDCHLHVEFNVDDNGKTGQANGNSGVYLLRRYEVQILNSAGQEPPGDDICGSIYKIKAEDENMSKPAGEWQTYDILFHPPRWDAAGKKTENAKITVYHNGTRVHENVDVPRPTGGGPAEAPGDGPVLLQDHGNKIKFRNSWISPLK
jgi:hypothetical protein